MMRKVVYDFAMTLDGYICRRDGGIEDFVPHGPHVDDYLERLQTYDTVLLGRRTYELGYKYGLVPGARPILTWNTLYSQRLLRLGTSAS